MAGFPHEIKIPITIEVKEEMADYCLTMLNNYLRHNHRMAPIPTRIEPKDELGYWQITLAQEEDKAC